LNGQYAPVGTAVEFLYWEHMSESNVLLAHTDGRWQFLRGASVETAEAIAGARDRTEESSGMPTSEFYDSAIGGASVSFACCMSTDSLLLGGLSDLGGSDADEEDGSSMGAALGVAAAFAGAVTLGGTAAFILQRRKTSNAASWWCKAGRYQTMTPPEQQKPTDNGECSIRIDGDGPIGGLDRSRNGLEKQAPGLGVAAVPGPRQQQSQQQRQQQHSQQHSQQQQQQQRQRPSPTQRSGHFAFPDAAEQIGAPLRRAAAAPGEDRAAAAVAAVLGRATPGAGGALGPGGVYEGPVNRWWENALRTPRATSSWRSARRSSCGAWRRTPHGTAPKARWRAWTLAAARCLCASPMGGASPSVPKIAASLGGPDQAAAPPPGVRRSRVQLGNQGRQRRPPCPQLPPRADEGLQAMQAPPRSAGPPPRG